MLIVVVGSIHNAIKLEVLWVEIFDFEKTKIKEKEDGENGVKW
jgi:hypothetical protein